MYKKEYGVLRVQLGQVMLIVATLVDNLCLSPLACN